MIRIYYPIFVFLGITFAIIALRTRRELRYWERKEVDQTLFQPENLKTSLEQEMNTALFCSALSFCAILLLESINRLFGQ